MNTSKTLRHGCYRMLRYSTMIGAAVLLSACGDENTDLNEWMTENTKDMRGKVEPLPPVEGYEPFVYSGFDLTDPFNLSKIIGDIKPKGSGVNAPDPNHVKQPLEHFELNQLKMVGTVSRQKRIFALVRTPDGTVYQVQKGNHMGMHYGVVTSINEAEVKLKEKVEDADGDWVIQDATVSLEEQEKK